MKKYISIGVPILIAILAIIYVIFSVVVYVQIGAISTVIGVALAVLFAIVMLGVAFQRIQEIRSGQEDDLSKY